MRLIASLAVIGTIGAASQSQAQTSSCAEALVIATYSRAKTEHSDYRLASYVSKSEYEQIKQNAGASAVIYGVPVGANWDDFQNRVRTVVENYAESLTHDQAENLMWTGLDPDAANAYSACLAEKVLSQPGLHLTVKTATKNDVAVQVTWIPVGRDPSKAPLAWVWHGSSTKAFPSRASSGTTTVSIPRPQGQQTLIVNSNGRSDALVISPLPPAPSMPLEVPVETTETYRSLPIDGWGDNWATGQVCTPEKPADWTIVAVTDFHLESNSERNNCGAYTSCTGGNTDTSRSACRSVSVQGHNENRYDGHGVAVAVLSVKWRYKIRVPRDGVARAAW